MISNKTTATLLFITLSMQLAASTLTNNSLETSPSAKVGLIKRRVPVPKSGRTALVLRDTDTQIADVQPTKDIVEIDISQRQLVDRRRKGSKFFEALMNRKQYKRILYFARRIGMANFLKHICLVVKTLEQYNGIVDYLKRHKMVTYFYVNGEMDVIKEITNAEPNIYDNSNYIGDGGLETALPLALKESRYDRVADLLNVRKMIGVEKDKRLGRGDWTSFECFVHSFLCGLAPWKDGMEFKRFLTIYGDKLRSEFPDILDTLCQMLVYYSKRNFDGPDRTKLLRDLVGQPSLLTPVSFTKGFLDGGSDYIRSNFIKYGWGEVIQEGLKNKYVYGSELLWSVMKKDLPNQFFGEYPPSNEMLVAILKHFPTKQKREMDWADENAVKLFNKIKTLGPIFNILPNVLWSIVSGYAISWTDTDDPTTSVQ